MSESYFFALCPRFLKVEHSFAKNIKPNTKYRLVLFKGIQKCDQMKEGIKSKIVGGKVEIQAPQLSFSIPYYSASKNIQFSIKLFEQKPNEEQTQIASYVFGSVDYIKSYKGDKQTAFQVNGQFQPDLSLQFDLFVEKSKQLLSEVVQKGSSNVPKSQKQLPQDVNSQSGQSKQLVREGDGFLSPRKRLERKRGHQGRLRSRSRSQQKGENLVKSPRRIQSPRSIPKSQTSVKSTNQPAEVKTQIGNQKVYQYQPASRLKYTDTKQIFDIQIERANSPVRSPRNLQDSASKATQQSRASFTAPQQQNNGQSVASSKVSTSPIPNIPSVTQSKTSVVSSPKSPGKYQPARSPRTSNFEDPEPEVKINFIETKKPSLNDSKSALGGNLMTPSFEHMKESTIMITVQGQVNEPRAVIIGAEQEDNEDIKVKAQPVTKIKESVHQSGTLKSSLRLSQVVHSKVHEEEVKLAEKSYEQKKNQIIYALFLIVSVFLIYNAMLPTRRV